MKGSMQNLYGLLRSIQMVTFSSLMRIPLQGFTALFFSGLFEFAGADVFDGSGLYEEMFTFIDTPAHNAKFAEVGIDS
jgi:hypothetical protein